MEVKRKGKIVIDEGRILEKMFVPIYEASLIAAKRLEEEAKMNLEEQIGATLVGDNPVSKSSGALYDSVLGYVRVNAKNNISIGVKASAIETGQWERSQGEEEEAEFTAGSGDYDYADAVENGTGIFANKGSISAGGDNDLTFWSGRYRDNGNRRVIKTPTIKGQPGKHFLRDAMQTSRADIMHLMNTINLTLSAKDLIR